MPKTPPCPPRRTPPSIRPMQPGMVRVVPAIYIDHNARANDSTVVYTVPEGAVAAIKEIAQRELLEELIADVRQRFTFAGESTLHYLQYTKAIKEDKWENPR